MLLSNIYTLVRKKKLTSVINNFKTLSTKTRYVKFISNFLLSKYLQQTGELFKISHSVLENQILLGRFRKGIKLKKILDKQDKKLAKKYF